MKTDDSLTWAIIGCGMIGTCLEPTDAAYGAQCHAAGVQSCEGVRLVAVCDADPGRARAAAARWGVPGCYADVATMLAEKQPDVVSIATPDDSHAALLNQLLNTACVKGILVEKPVVETVQEGEELSRLERAGGKHVVVNYVRRFLPGFQSLKAEIQAGTFGQVQSVTGYYTGTLLHNGSHWIDLAHYLLGEIDAVSAFCSTAGAQPALTFRFCSGQIGQLMPLDGRSFSHFEMDIVGTIGRARIHSGGDCIARERLEPSKVYANYKGLVRESDDARGLLRDLLCYPVRQLVGEIRGERTSLSSIASAVMAVRVAAAAGRSMASRGEWVDART